MVSKATPSTRFSRRARAALLEVAREANAFADLLLSVRPREAYLLLMVEQYHHMRHGERFMRSASEVIRATPALAHYRFVADYFDRHIEEEAGHDDLLVEDLEILGVSRQDILEHRPSAAVDAMVTRQAGLIEGGFPLDLLGYAYALEGEPPTEESIRYLQKWLALPDDGVRTLRLHARLDVEHAAELEQILDRIADPPTQARILINIRTTCRGFVQIIRASTSMASVPRSEGIRPAGSRV